MRCHTVLAAMITRTGALIRYLITAVLVILWPSTWPQSMVCTWNLDRRSIDSTRAHVIIDVAVSWEAPVTITLYSTSPPSPQSCVMCLSFHPEQPPVVAGGLFSGVPNERGTPPCDVSTWLLHHSLFFRWSDGVELWEGRGSRHVLLWTHRPWSQGTCLTGPDCFRAHNICVYTLTSLIACVAVLGSSSTGRETVSTTQTAQSGQRWPRPSMVLSEAGITAQSSPWLPTTDRQCST